MSELQPTNLLDLPNELLITILEFLPLTFIESVRQTCSKLYRISHSKEILKKQKFIFKFVDINEDEEKLNRIIEMDLPYLNLELNTYSSEHDVNLIERIISRMIRFLGSKIRSFNLTFNYEILPFSIVENILLTCVNLKELYLYSINFEDLGKTCIKSEDINTKLEILKIKRCYFSSSLIIDLILNFYPAIKTLQLCPIVKEGKITDFELFDEYAVRKVITYNKSIQDLDLRAINKYHGLAKTTFRELASADLELHNICLKYEEKISKEEFKILFSNYNLKELVLKDCDTFDEECFQYLMTYCSSLKRLYLRSTLDSRLGNRTYNNFDAECLYNLLIHCPKLENLSLWTRHHVFRFSHDFQIKPQLGINLKVLKFVNVNFHGGNTRTLNFPNLENLILKYCKTLDPINYFEFLNNCRLKRLIFRRCNFYIDLNRILSVSQGTLIKLKLQGLTEDHHSITISNVLFSKLERLFIYGLNSLVILQNSYFPCLRKLDIFSYEVNRECRIIARNCPLLENLFSMSRKMEKLDDQVLSDLRTLRFLRSFQRQDYKGSHEIIFPERPK